MKKGITPRVTCTRRLGRAPSCRRRHLLLPPSRLAFTREAAGKAHADREESGGGVFHLRHTSLHPHPVESVMAAATSVLPHSLPMQQGGPSPAACRAGQGSLLLCGGAGVGSGLIGALLDGAQVAAASKVGAGRSLSRRWSHPITSVNVSVWCLIWEDFFLQIYYGDTYQWIIGAWLHDVARRLYSGFWWLSLWLVCLRRCNAFCRR